MKKSELKNLIKECYRELNESINIVQEAEVDTWRFEAAHGKKPRGNGGWYFTKTNKDIDFHTDREGVDYVMIRGQFTKAWREAARKLNAARVWAQS